MADRAAGDLGSGDLTVDPDARHAHETGARRQGGHGRIAVEPDTGIITDSALTQASGAGSRDAAVGIDLITDVDTQVEVLADSAYGTGDALAALADARHTSIIKPWPLRPGVAGSPSTTSP